jgi:hypothetical protein
LPDGLSFKPKIPIGVNFGRPLIGKCWYILKPFEIFCMQTCAICYDHLVHFVLILKKCSGFAKKNLATLPQSKKMTHFLARNPW